MVRDRESEYQILNWRKQEPRDARDAGQLEKCAEASRSFRSVNPINVCSMHAMAHANPYGFTLEKVRQSPTLTHTLRAPR